MTSVVVSGPLTLDLVQHVSADGGVVDIGPSETVPTILEQGHGEAVAHGVDVDAGDEREQSLDPENNRAEGLAQHSEVRIVVSLNKPPLVQVDELQVVVADVHVEPVPGLGQDHVGGRLGVAGVDHDPGRGPPGLSHPDQ